MAGLTKRQADLLAFIQRQASRGVTPSYAEMSKALGLASKSGVHRLILALEERGRIRRIPEKNRSVEPIVSGRDMPDAAMAQIVAPTVAVILSGHDLQIAAQAARISGLQTIEFCRRAIRGAALQATKKSEGAA